MYGHHGTQPRPGSTNTTLRRGKRSNTPPMIHIPSASAADSATIGTKMPFCGVGSRRARSSSCVFMPMWQQIGSPVSWIAANSGS